MNGQYDHELNTTDPRDLQLQMIEDCLKRRNKISDWEFDFLFDIRESLDTYPTLTVKQVRVLNKIWDRVTEN
jgi:hypothetical protein